MYNKKFAAFRVGLLITLAGLGMYFIPEIITLDDIATGFVIGFIGTGALLAVLRTTKFI